MYVYEPFSHKTTKTSIEHLHAVTGIPKVTLYHQKLYGRYNHQLRCFLSDTLPRVRKKQMFNEKLDVDSECWKYNAKYDLYVSDLGRFKTSDGAFKFANDNKGSLTIIHNNKRYRASDIVFETFIKNLKTGLHAYPKDSVFNNLSANNLFATTLKKYRVYRRNEGRAKPIYLVDSNNQIVEEYCSTTEAEKHLYIDRRNIARRCNRKYVADGLMFMWASEYKEIAI